MEYSVTLKNLPQRRAACVRMTLPSYEAEHQLWQVMARETAPLSLRLEEPCLCSVTYYDGEYREREVDAAAKERKQFGKAIIDFPAVYEVLGMR